MVSRRRSLALMVFLCAAPVALHAQFDFSIEGRQVQIHSFASQGFLYTEGNNYLTTNSNQGSFAMTDGGVNVSSQITDKFRVGAQAYDRLLGHLSRGRLTLDWAYGDYKFKDWFGLRAGKVKTALGLYNDTQDVDFLHTFALLPQSIYPLDLRSSTIAHIGMDAYGTIGAKHLGSFAYTAYAGRRPSDPDDGYLYSRGKPITGYTGWLYGTDLRWTTPVKGFMVGYSYLQQYPRGSGAIQPNGLPYTISEPRDQINQLYAQYTLGGLTLDSEYNRHHGYLVRLGNRYDQEYKSWYVAGSYRIDKRFSVGSYHSRFYPDVTVPSNTSLTHIWDTALTGRLDLVNHWYLKIEGHYFDGFGDDASARGFYVQTNPTGEVPKTKLLIIRTGVNF
jgi:hypothetical protein